MSQCCRGVQHPLSASPMSSMYHNLLPISVPVYPHCPSLAFSKDSQVLFQATVSGHRIGQLLGHTLPALHVPQTAYVTVVAPLTLQLWHEHLNHRALDAVEHAVDHVEGLTIESKACPQHHCPACAAGKQHCDHSLPPLMPHVLLNWFILT